MPRRRRLPWFRLPDGKGRRAWRVFLVDRIPSPPDEDIAGICYYAERVIEVAAWQPFDEICHTAMHELMHAWGGDGGAEHDDREAEERYIRRAERRAFDGLTQLGMRLPDLPDGFDALRSRAIAMQKGAA